MAYDYNLGIKQFQEQQRAARVREEEQQRRDAAQVASESFRNTLAEQGERLKAANEAFQTAYKMHQDRKQETALQHGAMFMQGYNLIREQNNPNRRGQINELMSAFPEAMKIPEIQKMVSADNARLETKAGLTKDEQQFLKDHGPSSFGGKDKNYQALQTAAGDTGAAGHEEAAIAYGRLHDLMKKSVGLQSGTPEGISREDYIKNIESSFQKLPNGQPNPAYQAPAGAPPPSTPAPQNATDWAGADLSTQTAHLPGAPQAASPAPAATPQRQGVRDFLGLPKTSDAGAAAAATTNRNELNNMLGQSPETQFAAPQPTPTPTPQPNKEQYYTA